MSRPTEPPYGPVYAPTPVNPPATTVATVNAPETPARDAGNAAWIGVAVMVAVVGAVAWKWARIRARSANAPMNATKALVVIRPGFEERPPLLPRMLIEEIVGEGYLLSPRTFCRALPEGFEELPDDPALQPHGRGRMFYARVSEAWVHSHGDNPGVQRFQGLPCQTGWWRQT